MGYKEKDPNKIRCIYCKYDFVPEPIVTRNGGKRRTYIECPRCGNGIEREFRRYDVRKVAAVNG